ncbi:hypothetical protein MGN70_009327 [Eutypa lata]|uniref:Putative stress responsive a b barrel domain-containing protein n=1 Tax=Eutypa lata (strain UCR-EL1) TaxID=1287681 RepID=M7TU76_EUTLA|nr:putative stress responsive a b barrel domain-containing protein [Eutypa lata UCREL1]KAI1249713.1 hypothetical protein MGN70_009327 [Eutypa lata]
MPFVRTGLLAIADAEKQDKAINAFTTLREKGLKDGVPYILSSKASKCTVVNDKPGSAPWTIVYMIRFASQEDLDYMNEDPVFKQIKEKASVVDATGYISVVAEI